MNDDPRLSLPSASAFAMDVACEGRQNLLRELRGQLKPEDVPDEDKALRERGARIHEARRTGIVFELSADETQAYAKACALERSVVEEWMRDNEIEVVSDPIL